MHLKRLELNGFKSFAKKSEFVFDVPIIAIVGPNGSGKSNVVESIRFVLGEQSVKSMRSKTGADLIFKGSRNISKMSRASVTIVFDNKERVFHLHHHNNEKVNVDFDEVSITREVFADGGNKYMINGHEVRMKDVHELIGSVNIGASGHHIISQGEADRYLNANVKDRRGLIEEALGLKVYQYRLKESQRKLEKSQANMRESEMLRRELAPHLRFLKRQVDKIEKAKHLREDLAHRYKDYFSKEDYIIQDNKKKLNNNQNILLEKLKEISQFLDSHGDPAEKKHVYNEEQEIQKRQKYINDWRQKIAENTRELGKIEGMLSLLLEQKKKKENIDTQNKTHFSHIEVKNLFQKLLNLLKIISGQNFSDVARDIKNELSLFLDQDNDNQIQESQNSLDQKNIIDLEHKKNIILSATKEAEGYINELEKEISLLQEKLVSLQQQERESEKKYYEYIAVKKEINGKLELLESHKHSLEKRITDRNEEYEEALVLLGKESIVYEPFIFADDNQISLTLQEQSRREIERIKIRLEDIGGGGGGEVIKEYEETLERDAFLEKEILDISETINSLQNIIGDLKQTLNSEFIAGVDKINVQFDRFFKLMFGGGEARLEESIIKKRKRKSLNDDDSIDTNDNSEEEEEYGIDIKVKLPRKKVSDLDMLSGGERSLTSIALLFALSQVNPPPFLVLDETDAALDEANSQKYGDMIESLSEFSQLVVVTHNRETMSRAQTLFGVTLGRDDASTLLSLRLEDAEHYAK